MASKRDPELEADRQEGWRRRGESTRFDDELRAEATVICPQDFAIRRGDRPLDHWALQTLGMAAAGAHVGVQYLSQRKALVIKVVDPRRIAGQNIIEIRRDHQGFFLWLENIAFIRGDGRHGFGACAFYRCAQMAQRIGLHSIRCLAAGGDDYKIASTWVEGEWVGYFVWPLFGFDAQLHPETLARLAGRPALIGCTRLLDVVDADLDWWKEHGGGGPVAFDLAQGSRSWHTLCSYLLKKGHLS